MLSPYIFRPGYPGAAPAAAAADHALAHGIAAAFSTAAVFDVAALAVILATGRRLSRRR